MLVDALDIMKQKSGKTLQQISDECGIPKGTLNKIFAGQTKDPQYGTLKTIVHALGFTVDDLEKFENPEIKKDPTPAKARAGKATVEQIRQTLIQLGILRDGEDLTDADLLFLRIAFKSIADWFAQRGKGTQ